MIKAKIIDLLDDELAGKTAQYRLYVVRDGDIVFYVGRSTGVVNRLWQHLGKGTHSQGVSILGSFIKENLPKSGYFDIEFMKPEDVNSKYGSQYANPESTIVYAEQDLIRQLRPCLNSTYNENPTPLPDRYNPPFGATDLETTISDFVPF